MKSNSVEHYILQGIVMNEHQRHRKLLNYLSVNHEININEYISMFDVSKTTGRRDINNLSDEGLLKKVRNGAESLNYDLVNSAVKTIDFPIEKRKLLTKDVIAKAAVNICDDEDDIIISGGYTPSYMANYLQKKSLQIHSNYLPLINTLADQNYPNINILGGRYLSDKKIFLMDESTVQNKCRYIFLTATGLDTEGVYTSDLLVFLTEKILFGYAEKRVLMLDSSKIGKVTGRQLMAIDELDILITDSESDPEILEKLEKCGVQVVIAEHT